MRRASAAAARRREAALFVVPLLAALAAVAGWPLARTIWLSFTDATLTGGDHDFIGLANYAFLLEDPDWWRAVRNTLVFAAISVALETALGLAIALVLDAQIRLRGVLRAAVLVPWAIPTVVSAQLWAWMLHDQYGVINEVLLAFGLMDAPRAWLADRTLAMASVIAVDVWKTTPFMVLLLLAALQTVPRELHEAAMVDGAGAIRRFLVVTLPAIRPALLVAVIFRTLDALRIFDLIYVMVGNASATATMAVYARQHMVDFQDTGYGSAASTVLFAVIALAAALFIRLGRITAPPAAR
ncbi:carbohydrate ABC transporter permease [Elioraea sp. Yellowstone]|mgnify:CR=1 FL=1|uniref:carbohydrate ABC transporter permease n=1 Tax=Elioraea sp. Yellowstone TaxID=2592070 RepID=UPI00192A5559|nr:sugar ABC transporter permease [Elioraea sp. Yellowstone]